jgi:hypothetical protein
MGWICVTEETCNIVEGVWNGHGVAYFSIQEEITRLHEIIFAWFSQMTPFTFMIMGIFLTCIFVTHLLWNLKEVIFHA